MPENAFSWNLNACETLLANMKRRIEEAIGEELWEQSQKEVFDSGNDSWGMIACLAISYLRERAYSGDY